MLRRMLFVMVLISILAVAQESDEKKGDQVKKSEKDDQSYHVIEKVVVTATMTEKSLKDCSTSVVVIDHRDLISLSSSSALEILSYSPGIFVKKTGDFGRADVDIRGIGQNGRRIAVLVNGRPEKMGLFGCAVTHAFPLDNVERIEVVKGPASVLYGGEALGGAVNIITREPQKRSESDVTASFGSFNTQQFNLQHGGNLTHFKYFLTVDKRQSDGHIENSSYDGHSFTGRADYNITTSLRMGMQIKYFKGKKYEPGPVNDPLDDFWNDYERGSVDLTLLKKGAVDEFSLKLYRNSGNHRFSNGWDSNDYTQGGILHYTSHKIKNNVFTVGGDFRYFGGLSFGWPEGEWKKQEGAVFFHDEYILDSGWIFTGGLRLHFDSLYGREWSPHLGVVFRMNPRTSFRGVINKGFRSPQLNELYMYPSSNPDLEPERVWNYELGFEQDFGGPVKLSAGVFRMRGSNMIELVARTQGEEPSYIYRNTGTFDFFGVEAGLRVRTGSLFASELTYTYLNPGDKTKGRPGQKVDVSLRFHERRFRAALQGQYLTDYFAADDSEEKLPSYFLLNLRMSFRISRHVELFCDVNNVFDTDYLIYGEFPGLSAGMYQMPGRHINVGIRLGE